MSMQVKSAATGEDFSMEGWFRGRSVFLLVNGPSLEEFSKAGKLEALKERGITTMAVNNGWAIFKPNLWICVDPPGNFLMAGWSDPTIWKFILQGRLKDELHSKDPSTGEFVKAGVSATSMPNVVGIYANTAFNANDFLTEPTVNYGMNDKKVDGLGNKGSRSVMLAALKMLYYLGFRTVYIIGADFHMTEEKPYAFDQGKGSAGVSSNNNTYRILDSRFTALQPKFLEAGFTVFNCTPGSRLTAFPYKPFDEAVAETRHQYVTSTLDTKGWYGNLKVDEPKVQPPVGKRYLYRRIRGRSRGMNHPGGQGKMR